MANPSDIESTFDAVVDCAARELAKEAAKTVSRHPETENLVAYQEGRLRPQEGERIRRHIVTCAQCSEELLRLESFTFDHEEAAELGPSAAQTVEAWGAFQGAIGAKPTTAKVLTLPEPDDVPSTSELGLTSGSLTPRLILPWAASVALALGLGFWFGTTFPLDPAETDAVSQPASNSYFSDLRPDAAPAERAAVLTEEVVVPSGMDSVTLRLNLGDQTPYTSYRAEVLEQDGQVVWRHKGLLRQPAGQFVAVLRKDRVPQGRYRLRVLGSSLGSDVAADQETLLATYSFRLRYSGL